MNLNGFYQTNNKSITNTSSFSNTQSTPPRVNNTTNEFGNVVPVTFNQGIILPAGSSIIIDDGEGELPLASYDLSDSVNIAYLDVVNDFQHIPTFTDNSGTHQFLIAQPDITTPLNENTTHLSATTTTNTGGSHTTAVVPVPIPHHVTEKDNLGSHTHGLAFFSHLDPDGPGPLTHSIQKMSPYKVVTGDDKGALIGSYITSDKFASWVFGELTGKKENGIVDPTNHRDETDKYKHGLVPKGAQYIDGEAQEFLRKDGNWQSISSDLSSITTDTATISDMGLNLDFAGFSHKDLANFRDCALLQSKGGNTMINSSTGQPINFTFNGVQFTAQFTATEALFNVPMTIENAKISTMGFPTENKDAGFSQKDNDNKTSFAILQDKAGATYINAAVNEKISFRNNNVQMAEFKSNLATFNVSLVCQSIQTTTADISTINCDTINCDTITSPDADTVHEFGRAKIGYVGHSDYAGFGHRDYFNKDSFGFLQGPSGDTYVNCQSGETIHFGCDNDIIVSFTETVANFTIPIITPDADISTINCDTITSPDADTVYEFGKAKIGHVGHNDYAGFGHRDHFNISSYGFLQAPTGDVYVNCASGRPIYFRCNNIHLADFTINAANFSVPLEVASIKISIDGDDTVITPLSGTSGSYSFKTDQNANNTTVHANHTSNIRGNGSVIHVGNLSNGNVGVMMSHSASLSDSRLKKNQIDYLNGWEDFKTIKIKKYNRYGASESRIGVIADDIKIHPVPLIQDSYSEISGVTELSGVEYENLGGVDYQILYRMNIAVTQQLMERVEALEAKIISLLDNA